MSDIPQHSAKNSEWCTPPEVVERVHAVFGGPPDLDPASSPEHNQLMKATNILTKDDDSLNNNWPKARTVFLNPPGGKIAIPEGSRRLDDQKSLAGLYWGRFIDHYLRGDFESGIFLGFTLEILRTAQHYHVVLPQDCSFCVPAKRLRFMALQPDGTLKRGTKPAHANVIIFADHEPGRVQSFVEAFSTLGNVTVYP